MEAISITVSGTVYNFPDEKSLHDYIEGCNVNLESFQSDLTANKESLTYTRNRLYEVRTKVREFFVEELGGDTEVTLTLDTINDLLESIGVDKISKKWQIYVNIHAHIDDVEAMSEEEARELVEDAYVSVDMGDLNVDADEVEVVSIEEV